jgi:hypothetical protein
VCRRSLCFILISERRGRPELISGGFWRPAAAAAGESKALLLMGCTASAALCVSLQRDANAMHFALEPASSARLGFVFFMQLPAREMKHFYLDSQSEKKKKKTLSPPPPGEKLFVHAARCIHSSLSHTCK